MTEARQKAWQPKLLVKHKDDCWAVEMYGSDWVLDRTETMYRDKNGRVHPKAVNRFAVFTCNCYGCPAIGVMREYDLLTAAGILRPERKR